MANQYTNPIIIEPELLWALYCGYTNHREKCNEWIEDFYGINIKELMF